MLSGIPAVGLIHSSVERPNEKVPHNMSVRSETKADDADTLPLTLGFNASFNFPHECRMKGEKQNGNSRVVDGGGSGGTAAVVFMVNQVCLALCSICLLLLRCHM